jgi:hypothetical protein
MQQIPWAQGSFQPSPCLQLEQGNPLVVRTRHKKKEGIFVCMNRGAIVLISRHEKLNYIPAAVLALSQKCFEYANHISQNKNNRPKTPTTALSAVSRRIACDFTSPTDFN